MILDADLGYAQKDEGEKYTDVSPVSLGSKESHDPSTIKLGRWLRAKSLHSIMIEDKKSEMKV
ncbi:hypothetical protein [Saccharolobus shibatae]|uniref:ISC1913 family transposase, Second ORF n=1 Tax=Saccharolobus shibatae TaxID=2286 RepID=A0A8F5C0Q8_9CREN|nr:hypothetical protein [Saccharolobus shibatae]QXJ34823.1 ISC1913 family transposase, Second ORF [Saccharolobus shibatae]